MKKRIAVMLLITLSACQGNKEVKLPDATLTVVADVQNHSPVYIFFAKQEKDTLAEVNRNNTISNTNWIFNIDKRLPLRLVIPEIVKLQTKKETSIHKSEETENYFAYANTVKKTMAFLPFTKVNYIQSKPKQGIAISFAKDNTLWINDASVSQDQLMEYLTKMPKEKQYEYVFCFEKEMNFNQYFNDELFINSLKKKFPTTHFNKNEFVY
ncbi:hypothetical protein [Flavobacterium aciduliphilum]|uniref:Lipoprotein n=1 Tax=Flavobacterium aciduliphilum TaxID=1101402 RepID=A0A328YDT9_9FLAO|nr:hypothetical protein [Flavobacterium aciduliphilum]RAR70775.1 hypothetical protein CLV55_10926 [Flavobacterium aciduliphilum]